VAPASTLPLATHSAIQPRQSARPAYGGARILAAWLQGSHGEAEAVQETQVQDIEES
jgi:hypothetical protein